jgi:hypothetical protein
MEIRRLLDLLYLEMEMYHPLEQFFKDSRT